MSFITRIMQIIRGEPRHSDYTEGPTSYVPPPPMITYEISENGGGVMFIRCLVCNLKSFNSEDIRHKWCANCNQYHPINKQLVRT